MNNFKKIFALVIACVMTIGMMSAVAFAAGTNSITVSGAKNGETYNIYKLLDLSVAGMETTNDTTDDSYRYTINEKWAGFWTGTGAGAAYITTNTSGSYTYVTWKDDKKTAADMEAFAKAASKYATDNSIAPDADAVTTVSTGTAVASWSGLDNGYYLVTSTYGTAASVASTPSNPAQTISEKNTDNTSDKEVQEAAERNGTPASWPAEKANDAAIGDTIVFRSKVSIVKNTINLIYHDTMTDGLTWTGASGTKVYTDAACTTELNSSNYTVAAGTAPETFTVTFTDAYLAGLTEATTDVWVGYSAVLNDNATVQTEQKNTGKITWGNNGQGTPTETKTKTHKFQILKYDSADANKNPLDGAKFQLYTTATGGTPLQLAKNAAGTIYRVVDTSDQGTTLPEGYTLVTDNKIVTLATEKITIEGVDSDDYYLDETEAPTGFNKLDNRVKVQVNAENNLIAEIKNKSGVTLPSTGGIGTTIFYVIGGILILGAAIALIGKKRFAR